MSSIFLQCITGLHVNFMMLAFVCGLIVTLWVLWRVQRSPKNIDFVDLLLDTDGKASWTKITAIGAFAVASWAFVALVQQGKMTEWLFGLYIAVYSGVPVAYKFIASRQPIDPPQPGAPSP
jgi:hypothetical protein